MERKAIPFSSPLWSIEAWSHPHNICDSRLLDIAVRIPGLLQSTDDVLQGLGTEVKLAQLVGALKLCAKEIQALWADRAAKSGAPLFEVCTLTRFPNFCKTESNYDPTVKALHFPAFEAADFCSVCWLFLLITRKALLSLLLKWPRLESLIYKERLYQSSAATALNLVMTLPYLLQPQMGLLGQGAALAPFQVLTANLDCPVFEAWKGWHETLTRTLYSDTLGTLPVTAVELIHNVKKALTLTDIELVGGPQKARGPH